MGLKEDKWKETKKERIGYTLSNASSVQAPIHLIEGKTPEEESLVAIQDGNRILVGIIRGLKSLEPSLRVYTVSHFIWRPDLLKECEEILNRYTTGMVYIVGEVRERNGSLFLEENRFPPAPGSYVFEIKSPELLDSTIRIKPSISVGMHKFSQWEFPLNSRFISYHVGIFGATGTGKSRLATVLVKELLEKTDYNVIIFDHTGVDYVPFFSKDSIVSSEHIAISPSIIASILTRQSNLDWRNFGTYFELACLVYDGIRKGSTSNNQNSVLTKIIRLYQRLQMMGRKVYPPRILKALSQKEIGDEKLRELFEKIRKEGWTKDGFTEVLSDLALSFGAKSPTIMKMTSYVYQFLPERTFKKLNERILAPEEVVEKTLERRLTVIDMSKDTEIEVKQSIIKSILETAWKKTLEEGKELRMVFVIDEAQNYAPSDWTLCKEVIEKTAREGRKWGLSLVLVSQRYSADIDPSIRANLNTIFFSKLTAQTDISELQKYLELSGVGYEILGKLREREFFVAGLMNPLGIPVLITVREIRG